MNIKIKFILFLIATIFLSAELNAEYVGDRLYLGLYEQADTTNSPIKTLTSGTSVEVLQNEGDFKKIRLQDGTEGWVRAEFISDKIPATRQLIEVTADRDKLRNQLRRMGLEQDAIKQLDILLAKANQTISEQNKKLENKAGVESEQAGLQSQEKQAEISEWQARLDVANSSITKLRQEIITISSASDVANISNKEGLTKIVWILFTMLICLLAGVLIGIYWLSGKVKQRFNGLKVW